MLTRLREIVEKVASAPRLNEALNILVTDICLAMDTEVCSVYLADHDRRCYYLMATRGLKKPRGRTVALAFDEGIVGLVGRLAEPINLADAQKHPSFKYIPSVKRSVFARFSACRSFSVANFSACWSYSSANCASTMKRRVFPRHARYADGGYPVTVAGHSAVRAIPADANPRASCGAGRGYRNGLARRNHAADGTGLRSVYAGYLS